MHSEVVGLLQQHFAERMPDNPELDTVATDEGPQFKDVDPLSSDSELEDLRVTQKP